MPRERMAAWRSAEGLGRAWWIGTAAAAVVLGALLAFTGPGHAIVRAVFRFLEFYTGVFALVALSLTVMGGFVATDRVVLLARHRVMLQNAHRLTGLLAITFLAVHIILKVAEGHASVVAVVLPFVSANRRLFVGFGTIAAYLMAGLVWTGFSRARFASGNRPWLWRAVHISAYPAWVVALIHGLNSGRPAASWVTVSYILCVVLVGLGVLVRVGVSTRRRAQSTSPAKGPTHAAPATAANPGAGFTAVPPPQQPRAPLAIETPMRRRDAQRPGRRRMTGSGPRPPLSDDDFWRQVKGDPT